MMHGSLIITETLCVCIATILYLTFGCKEYAVLLQSTDHFSASVLAKASSGLATLQYFSKVALTLTN